MNSTDLIAALFSLLTVGLLIGSVAFWIGVIRELRAGGTPIPNRYRFRPVHVPRFAVVVTLCMLGIAGWFVMAGSASTTLPSMDTIRQVVLGTIAEGILMIVLLISALFVGARSRTDLFRLGFRCDNINDQLRTGVIGLVATFLPVAAALLLTSPLRSEETEHPFLRLLKETHFGSGMLLIIISAAIIAPLKEELMFRVVLQSWLEEFCPPWLAVVISSATFAAVHGIPDSLALIPLALVLGILFQRRRSYLAVVTVHALFNAYNLMATLVGIG